MSKSPYELITEYVKILSRDPASKVFAPLSQAYRESGQLKEAEQVARIGVQRHPDYYGGYMALGRVLVDQDRFEEALVELQRVAELSPENVLCYDLMGQIYLNLDRPKEALKAYKMALFLNPLSSNSRKAIEKLEVLTAEDYESDVFELGTTKNLNTKLNSNLDTNNLSVGVSTNLSMERTLSLLDAFLVRNEVTKAMEIYQNLLSRYPQHPEVVKRGMMLESDKEPIPEIVPLSPPLADRVEFSARKKIEKLEQLLLLIQSKAPDPNFLNTPSSEQK